MKKILFDGRFLSLSHAGIGRYSCEILKNILLLDKKQKFIVPLIRGTEIDQDLSDALTLREEPVDIIEVDEKHYSLGEQTRYLKLLNELKPDLVHFPHFNHPVFYRGNFVVTIHDLTLSQFAERRGVLKRWVYSKVITHAAEKSQAIFTVSQFAKSDLARGFGLPKSKIVVTYNGIDKRFKKITNPSALKKIEKYSLDKPYILSVGQWRSHKNLPRLVEAFAELQKDEKFKDKIDLVFAGRIDPKFPDLPKKVRELNLEKSVKFIGFVPDDELPIIYNMAEIFVFPSLSEGFGLPGLEAQACFTPVAASRRSSLPEILGEGALYFEPGKPLEISKKIATVLEDKKVSQELILKGLENTKRFSWEDSAKKTFEVYREILYK